MNYYNLVNSNLFVKYFYLKLYKLNVMDLINILKFYYFIISVYENCVSNEQKININVKYCVHCHCNC